MGTSRSERGVRFSVGQSGLFESGSVVDDLRTVGIFVGPYRNLTTLTASVLALHPQCQVLNHGGKRLLTKSCDFIADYSDERLALFCRSALQASATGKNGDFGGSIVYSHAFKSEQLRNLYAERFGTTLLKEHPTSLVWKESQFVTSRIRNPPYSGGHLPPAELALAAPKLRFLLPVRNPLDCARSNVRRGLAQRLPGKAHDAGSVLRWILQTVAWFARLARENPAQFLMFYEDDPPEMIAGAVQIFLELDDDAQWQRAFASAFTVQGRKPVHGPPMYTIFEQQVARRLADFPEVAARLRAIVGSPAPG
jgi:hypothetical protein